MTDAQQPAVQRRRLRTELRRTRLDAGLTQSTVARALDWSASKLIRIESGEVSISITDLRALLAHYQAHGQELSPDRVEELVTLARSSKKQPFAGYRDVYSQEFLYYLSYEASASIIRQVEPTLVPGLLQTEEYARAVLSEAYGSPPDAAARQWEARQERQELLDRDKPPEMFFILDEAVIRRVVGGSRVMRRQLEHLKELSHRDFITVQIIPFAVGANPGMRGSAVVLEFPDPEDDNLLYVENATGTSTTRDDRSDEPYLSTFLGLEERAAKGKAVDALLDDAIAGMSATA